MPHSRAPQHAPGDPQLHPGTYPRPSVDRILAHRERPFEEACGTSCGPLRCFPIMIPSIVLVPRERVRDPLREHVDALIASRSAELRKLAWVSFWREQPGMNTFVVLDAVSGAPVGLVTWTGPPHRAEPSWWIAEQGRGYGGRAVDRMAVEMRRRGVTAIKDSVTIDTLDEESRKRSKALVDRLRQELRRLIVSDGREGAHAHR